MDRSAAPWRVLEEPDPNTVGPDAPAGGDRAERVGVPKRGAADATARPDRTGLAAGWLVAGALLAAAAVALAIFVAVGAANPTIDLPAGLNDLASSGPSVRAGVGGSGNLGVSDPAGGVTASGADGAGANGIVVEVAGAVARPGLYHLAPRARVADAITAAGGYSRRVDATRTTGAVNLAAHLADGDRVIVPSRDDPAAVLGASGGSTSVGAGGSSGGAGSGAIAAGSGLVDLNRATAAELDALPGIGPVTAAKIVAARQERPFRSVDELRDRKLVGASVFARLRSRVTVH